MSQPRSTSASPVISRGCGTCRHLWGATIVTPGYLRCMHAGGNDARQVYMEVCKGLNWEAEPMPLPVLVRLKRWLVG